MANDTNEGIYRAMIEENGMPRLGQSATTLGIRHGKDIVPDSASLVHRPAFQPGEKNGLSCSRTIMHLPPFTLPVVWGGKNKKTSVWKIEEDDLPAELVAGDDAIVGKNKHVSIGPALTMSLDDYVSVIEATQLMWKKIEKQWVYHEPKTRRSDGIAQRGGSRCSARVSVSSPKSRSASPRSLPDLRTNLA